MVAELVVVTVGIEVDGLATVAIVVDGFVELGSVLVVELVDVAFGVLSVDFIGVVLSTVDVADTVD